MVPKKVAERLSRKVAAFQKVLKGALDRDVNESDTVTIITDMLAGVFGFDKYTEITSEQVIRGTFCDLAIQVDGTVKYLIEVKAIGLTLKDNHLRQAVNYGANHGISWVVLTNGVVWEIHKIKFEKPISSEQVCTLDFTDLNPKRKEAQERLYLLTKEGMAKSAIETFHRHVQTVNRFVVSAIIQSEASLRLIRREIRKLVPKFKVSTQEIRVLLSDVLKRDVMVGAQVASAKKRVIKSRKTPTRRRSGQKSLATPRSARSVMGQPRTQPRKRA